MVIPLAGWVAPFGDPGITDRSHLPRAFRSVPRPSSPLSAKASTRCPYSRLITGLSVRRGRTKPPRTGAKPQLSAASHEDTSSDEPKPCGPSQSASVTLQLSLHPSISTPARSAQQRPGTVSRFIFSERRATPVARRTRGPPVVEVNGIEPMTSCLQSRRSPN